MHENFIAMDAEKRDRIINAAMAEFALEGFTRASTNVIVKNAGISKSLLFYYFTSKEDLFTFLFQYAVKQSLDNFMSLATNLSSDVFERWTEIVVLKLKLAAQYPDITAFLQTATRDDVNIVQGAVKEEYDKVAAISVKLVYDGIDTSKFKTDIDIPKAFEIIWFFLEGISLSRQKEALYDLTKAYERDYAENLTNEINSYLSILKKAFYK